MRTREAMDLLRVEEPDTERIDSNRNGEQVKRKPVTLTRMDQYRPAHIDAKDAIAYAAMAMKHYYDRKHKLLYFKARDLVTLRLHKGYTLPSLKDKNKKLGQQFFDFPLLFAVHYNSFRLFWPWPLIWVLGMSWLQVSYRYNIMNAPAEPITRREFLPLPPRHSPPSPDITVPVHSRTRKAHAVQRSTAKASFTPPGCASPICRLGNHKLSRK